MTAQVRTRRDAAVAVYTLLAAIGRLDATGLKLRHRRLRSRYPLPRGAWKWHGTSIAPRREQRPVLIDDEGGGDGLQLIETDPLRRRA